jgi:hypothetical protein
MVYKLVRDIAQLGFEIGVYAVRTTATANALYHRADIIRQHRHHPHLRSPHGAAGRRSDVQGQLLREHNIGNYFIAFIL